MDIKKGDTLKCKKDIFFEGHRENICNKGDNFDVINLNSNYVTLKNTLKY